MKSKHDSQSDLRIDDYFESLLSSIEMKYGDPNTPPISLSDWAEKTPIILDGKPFTFRRHEYLIEPYQENHPYVVEEKAAQMGLTSKAMLLAEYLKVDTTWVYKTVSLKTLPFFKSGKYTRFRKRDIDKWTDSQACGPVPPLKAIKKVVAT